jgi:hypothetical protein
MPSSGTLPNIDHLDVAARVELLGRVWDSLIESNGLPPLPDWHMREVARRIARADAEPGTGIPLSQLRNELMGGKP